MNLETGIHKTHNRYTGERRHEIKDYDKVYEYRGYTIKRNAYVPKGGANRIEVPDLYIPRGKEPKKGFFTVSEVQAREKIDEFFEYSEMMTQLNKENEK